MEFKSPIDNRVHRQIVAEDYLATTLLEILPKISNLLQHYNGSKTHKVDGSQTIQFAKEWDALVGLLEMRDRTQNFRYRKHTSRLSNLHYGSNTSSLYFKLEGWFTWEIYDTEHRADDGDYYSIEIYVGSIKDGILEYSIEDRLHRIEEHLNGLRAVKWSTVYSKLQVIKELKSQLHEAKKGLPYYALK